MKTKIKCTCKCHEPGVQLIHMFPCCDKDGYKELTLEDIEKTVREVFSQQEPDLIVRITETTFSVAINGPQLRVNTGKGGLKLFLQALPVGGAFLKISVNGTILDDEQTKQFILQYGK